jgi:DNA/RNA-binding domain of Phe-tRNA-synthetase-like protein
MSSSGGAGAGVRVPQARRADTTEILVTVEGHHDTAADDVAHALEALDELLREHAGGHIAGRAILTARDAVFGSA